MMGSPDPAELRANFYGFPKFPFHVHLGMTFERLEPSGRARIAIPASASIAAADGRQSVVAVYTVGEVAAGIEVCDSLVPYGAELGMGVLVLTRSASFRSLAGACGEVRAETRFAADPDAVAQRLAARRKASADVAVTVLDERDVPVGEHTVCFYIRLVDERRMAAMKALIPTTTE
jgi:hypothetical protein